MSSENYLIYNQNAVHFLTFTVIDWIDVFTRASYKTEIVKSLEYCQKNKGLRLFAWCLMTNHLHLVCQVEAPNTLSAFVRDFKKFTAKAILKMIWEERESRRSWILAALREAGKYDNRITNYKFWHEGCHPIELTSNEMIDQRINYVHENPVRNMIVEKEEDYLMSSARNYASLESVLDVEVIR
jgi:putative transposase